MPARPLPVLAVGADHAGWELKNALAAHLRRLGHEVLDHGATDGASVDYPDYAKVVCRDVLAGRAALGLLVCGSGVGMCIAANRFKGIRAVLPSSAEVARLSRQHNDANVLCLGARFVEPGEAVTILDSWLGARFEGGRHLKRVAKMDEVAGGD